MKLLATITAVLLSATSAPATETHYTMQSGYWSTFSTYANNVKVKDAGAAICGMQTTSGWANAEATVFVKYIHGKPGITFQIFKRGWQGSYHIPMKIFLDSQNYF